MVLLELNYKTIAWNIRYFLLNIANHCFFPEKIMPPTKRRRKVLMKIRLSPLKTTRKFPRKTYLRKIHFYVPTENVIA